MKKILPLALALHAAGFAAAALAHTAGYLRFNVLTPGGIAGALMIAGVLAFTCADYRRKPSFRIRTTTPQPLDPRPAVAPPDWTYTTRTN